MNLEGASPKRISQRPINTGGVSPPPSPGRHNTRQTREGPALRERQRGRRAVRARLWSHRNACALPQARGRHSPPAGSAGEHLTERPAMCTDVARVRDRSTSEKTPRRHYSPSPRKQPQHPSAGGWKAPGWRVRHTEMSLSGSNRHQRARAAQPIETELQTRGGRLPQAGHTLTESRPKY